MEFSGQVNHPSWDYGYGWNHRETNVNFLALDEIAMAESFRTGRRFLESPVNFYLLPQQLLQTRTLELASECGRFGSTPADRQTRIYLVRPSC
jgi:hypothetical protein